MDADERYTCWVKGVCLLLQDSEMTQDALGKKVGSSREHINAIVNGRKRAGTELQDKISLALDMSYDQVRNLGRKARGLPPIRVFAELGAPHQSVDDESTSVDQTGMNCSTVVNGGGSVNVNGVNNGTVKACGGPPCPKTEKPMGDIARELCELIATQLEGKDMDIQIAVRAQVKAALNAALEQAKMGR